MTQSSEHSTDVLAALAESILTMDAVERLVKTFKCPLVTAQYLMLVNRLRASAPCLEALELVLTERVFTDEEEASGRGEVVVVDVWQPLFLKVGTVLLSSVVYPGCYSGMRVFPSRIPVLDFSVLTKIGGFVLSRAHVDVASSYGIKLLTSFSNSSLLECSPPIAEARVRCQSRVL